MQPEPLAARLCAAGIGWVPSTVPIYMRVLRGGGAEARDTGVAELWFSAVHFACYHPRTPCPLCLSAPSEAQYYKPKILAYHKRSKPSFISISPRLLFMQQCASVLFRLFRGCYRELGVSDPLVEGGSQTKRWLRSRGWRRMRYLWQTRRWRLRR